MPPLYQSCFIGATALSAAWAATGRFKSSKPSTMSVRHSIATYLRDQRLELEDALAQSLLDSTTGRIDLDSRSLLGSCGSIDKLNFDPSPKKKFHGTITIRLKSDATLATTGTTGSDEEFLTNQYNVYTAENEIVEEPYLIPFDDHPYLSPAKPSAEALILSIHLFDFSFGVFLIARGLMSMMDQYGNLIVSLLLGTLLLSGSIAGMCWRILLSKRVKNRSFTIFNIALGFVGFGIYYVVSRSSAVLYLDIIYFANISYVSQMI